uniref:Uncharacterized protein n=1 Tax=Rhizophora mucronata TaxID=61149 RepID=A0A2P2MT85_RHIMU
MCLDPFGAEFGAILIFFSFVFNFSFLAWGTGVPVEFIGIIRKKPPQMDNFSSGDLLIYISIFWEDYYK